ncbi:MAG: hypothetical protein ACI4F0_09110 [Agathobacter sp.]
MRFKYYLRGAGIGILFAAIIMMVAFHSHGSNISDDEVVQRAGELGMVWPETESEAESEIITETESQTESVQNEKQQEASNPDTASNLEEEIPEFENQDMPAQENDSVVKITVVQGEVCRTLAEDLVAAGLIEDAEDFRKYMGDHNYANSIHVGEFEIPRGSTYEEIARILVN